MGPYTDWDNETWVWYTDLMFEIGLWTEENDVDVYLTPGAEAIAPQATIQIATNHLLALGASPSAINNAKIFWHYYTHASDIARNNVVYLITFRYSDQSEDNTFLTPDGQLK